MTQSAVRHVSLPADEVVKPGKRTYTRMEQKRPEMTKLLMAGLRAAVGDETMAAVAAQCAEEYKKRHCGEGEALDTKYLAQDTLRRLEVDGHVQDLWRSGRPQIAADEDVEEFLDIFLAGNGLTGDDWWGYTSLTHALLANARLRALKDKMGIEDDQLWNRMVALNRARGHGNKLNKINIIRKAKLTKEVKKERREGAAEWQKWGVDKLCKVVWIDEKRGYLHSGGVYTCYAPHGVQSMQRETKTQLGKSQKVKYKAAVSAFGGALYFTFITGTTGRVQLYKVRTFVPQRRNLDPARGGALPPCLVHDLVLSKGVLVRDA